jgi:hypothetical protein
MSLGEDQTDCCPHCRKPFEIIDVKFRLSGTAIIACCPNCAMVSVDVLPAAESQIIEKGQKVSHHNSGLLAESCHPDNGINQ